METTKGICLMFQQTKALIVKNFLLSWRNKRATILQLLSSLFFIAMLYGIDKANDANYLGTTAFTSVKDPPALISPPILPCEDMYYLESPCFDFVWSGNSSSRISAIVESIRNNNDGRTIPNSKVLSFRTAEDVDSWLITNPMRCGGAIHFTEFNSSVISYGLQTNTSNFLRGLFEDPTFKLRVPLQIAAEKEIARELLGNVGFSWDFGFKEFAHPARNGLSALRTVGPIFFLAFTMFGFVLQISSIVVEKELKLRQAMSMTGLYDSAYWVSWLLWDSVLIFVSSTLLILFGVMFQFNFFKRNNYFVLFFFFYLFQLNMTGFAYLLSNAISKSVASTIVGFGVFIVAFFTQLVTAFGFPYRRTVPSYWRPIWSIFPPNLLAEGISMLNEATATPEDKGITWGGRKRCFNTARTCRLTINDIYLWLLGTFCAWMLLAIYLDNVIPNASGSRKSLFYWLAPGYWTGRGKSKVKDGSVCSCCSKVPEDEYLTPEDEDVLEEENAVKAEMQKGNANDDVAVHILGLRKTFPSYKKPGCCTCKMNPPYQAVKGLWINLKKNQLFCLLGPNGAGKTTVINCLTGVTPVTSGDGLIYGNSVRSSVGMSNIRKLIGVCPQFDILWDALTGEEHVRLFASLKGLTSSAIDHILEGTLENVKLTKAAKVRTRSYSGGMKRRLSVAIALIGDPKLVFLDEPTTGMDPISRRLVWDIIQTAKKGRAIILTTHSMEEADVLNDRLGIMAKGRLRCLGTSIRLKSKFGTGFVTNVSFSDAQSSHESVKDFFKNELNVVPAEESAAFMTFVIPREKEPLLTSFFAELQDREGKFGITDIQLGLASLEEVFLNIASQAEVENATAEGRLATVALESGVSVMVPIGARYVAVPGTETAENPRGVMVEVQWAQDDTGLLSVSWHSDEIPLPDYVELPAAAAAAVGSSRLGGKGRPVVGTVIHPDQIRTGSSRRFSSSSRRFASVL